MRSSGSGTNDFFSHKSLFELLDMRSRSGVMAPGFYYYVTSLKPIDGGGERLLDLVHLDRLTNYDFLADLAEVSFSEEGEFNYTLVDLADPESLRHLSNLSTFHCFHLYTNKNVMLQMGGEKGAPYFLANFKEIPWMFQPEEIMVVGRFDGLHVDVNGQWKNSFGCLNLFFYVV